MQSLTQHILQNVSFSQSVFLVVILYSIKPINSSLWVNGESLKFGCKGGNSRNSGVSKSVEKWQRTFWRRKMEKMWKSSIFLCCRYEKILFACVMKTKHYFTGIFFFPQFCGKKMRANPWNDKTMWSMKICDSKGSRNSQKEWVALQINGWWEIFQFIKVFPRRFLCVSLWGKMGKSILPSCTLQIQSGISAEEEKKTEKCAELLVGSRMDYKLQLGLNLHSFFIYILLW